MTALMYSAYKGKLSAVEHLLQNGADPNADSTKDQVSAVWMSQFFYYTCL